MQKHKALAFTGHRPESLPLETYSSAPLPRCGVYRYCDAPDFEILLFSYAFDDEPGKPRQCEPVEGMAGGSGYAYGESRQEDRAGEGGAGGWYCF